MSISTAQFAQPLSFDRKQIAALFTFCDTEED